MGPRHESGRMSRNVVSAYISSQRVPQKSTVMKKVSQEVRQREQQEYACVGGSGKHSHSLSLDLNASPALSAEISVVSSALTDQLSQPRDPQEGGCIVQTTLRS